jgi:hypothetical protein
VTGSRRARRVVATDPAIASFLMRYLPGRSAISGTLIRKVQFVNN